MLRESDPASRRATVEIQRNLAELNFLSRSFSRTRRRDVHLGTVRAASVVKIRMTEAERGFYRAVLEFVRARYRREGKDVALLFGLMMPQRQLASCIPAMVEYYESQVGEASDTSIPEIDNEALREAYSVAESVLAQRFQGRRERVERLNEAFVNARLASVHESYRSKIQRKEALLERAQANKQAASYIQMLEGGIRNLIAEQESRELQINELRSVTAEHSTTAAGFLNVVMNGGVR